MTCIATDGKSMAGDGLEVEGETVTGRSVKKVRKLDDGRIVGTAGSSVDGQAFVRWLTEGGSKPKVKDLTALVLHPDHQVDWYGEQLVPCPAEVPAAIGSGKAHALTAMDCGKSPKEAVRFAERRDPHTGGEITVLSL